MNRLPSVKPAAIVALLLPLVGATACDAPSSGGTSTAPPQNSAAPQATEIATHAPTLASQEQPPGGAETPLDVSHLDDANVAAVLLSVHQRIAQQAQLGEHSGRSAQVKQLSHDLSALHSDVLTTEQYLFQRLSIVPRADAVSQQIDADATNAIKTLRGDRGGTFDRDYLDTQSRTFHAAIDLFDRLYAVTKAADLRSEIARSRPDLQAGMQSVSQLQQFLNVGVTNLQGK
jgi:hypothetical protein